jgi:hypothetical protein
MQHTRSPKESLKNALILMNLAGKWIQRWIADEAAFFGSAGRVSTLLEEDAARAVSMRWTP